MIITLTLNPSIDYIMQVPEIHAEDTLRASAAFFQPGGKGINVSRVLTRLGVVNRAWGFCGGDTGQWLRDDLAMEEVPHEFIQTRQETRINTIITEVSTHKQIRVSAKGGEIHHVELQSLKKALAALSSDVSWLVMGGSLPPGVESDIYRKLIAQAKAKGISCLLDADGESLTQGLKANPDVIKPNRYELARLLDRPLESHKAMVEGAKELIDSGQVAMVVVSLDKSGALLVSKDEVLYGEAPQVEVKSKVGAGDAMVAGLVYGFDKKLPLEDTLKHGLACGTAAVITPGTELSRMEDVNQLYPQIQVKAFTAV